MYCEIVVKHGAPITEAGLQASVCGGQLGAPIALAVAYSRSGIYGRVAPAHSIGAFETVHRCFVIVREVNSRFSTYHIEGNTAAVSAQALLEAVQDFAEPLFAVLRTAAGGRAFRASALTVQLFEDNGDETGILGKFTTFGSILREKFSWASLRASVIAFATSAVLIWRGLKQEPLLAGIYSLAIVLVFTVLETIVGYIFERGKIKWRLRQA